MGQSLERTLREQWEEGHLRVHALERQLVEQTKVELAHRLEGMNELREQVTKERGMFLQRDIYDREHTTLRDQMDARLKTLETAYANMQGRLWMMGAAISLFVTLLAILINVIFKAWH